MSSRLFYLWCLLPALSEGALEVPSNLRTAAPFFNTGSIELAWIDQSEEEVGFEVELSNDGVTGWNSLIEADANQTRVALTGGAAGATFFFRVRALSVDGEDSPFTEPVSVTLPSTVAISVGLFDGGQVGSPITAPTPFVSRAPGQTGELSFSGEGLPDGFTIDSETGVISGTPLTAGIFRPLLLVDDGVSVASTFVTLRVVAADSNPSVKQDVVLLSTDSSAKFFETGDLFEDVDTQDAVRVVTNEGEIDVLLYSEATPITVNNFLSYVDDGAYSNVMFHRAVNTGISIIQAGFLRPDPDGSSTSYLTVPTFPQIINEPGLSNIRGTIAPAKTANPDSATSQWFFNTADNSSSLDNPNNSGGFSVFGRASNPTLPVLDQIQNRPTGTSSLSINGSETSLNDWPTRQVVPDEESPDPATDLILIESASRISSVTASLESGYSSNLLEISVEGDEIQICGLEGGQENVPFVLTDLDGNIVTASVQVFVLDFDITASTSGEEQGRVSFLHLKETPGFQYRVETSTDLMQWNDFWTTSDGFSVPDLLTQEDLGESYRLTFAVDLSALVDEQVFFRVLGEVLTD